MKIQDYWDKIKLLLNKDRRTEWTKLAKEYTERGMMNSEWNLGYLEVLNLLLQTEPMTLRLGLKLFQEYLPYWGCLESLVI